MRSSGGAARTSTPRLNRQLDPTHVGFDAEKLETDLSKRIVGQAEAIRQVVNIYQTYLAGMAASGHPIGNFLFLGPTGTGKTRLVEATAESFVGDMRAVVKIDCAEFQHSHEIAKLIGSPPGYLGHRETHPLLSQEVLNQYHTEKVKISFVLFDEIEKASDALWNLLLGILDRATLTLGDNRRVDFSRAIIFMTSNLGAAEMSNILRPNVGFAAGEIERKAAAGIANEKLNVKIGNAGIAAARRKFTPEFMNRIDKTVVFRPLGEPELRKILALELNIIQQRIFNSASSAPFVFSCTETAEDFLLREGTDMKYGARHLKRAIDHNLVHPLSNLIATRQVCGGDLIRVDFDGDTRRLTFFKEAEDMPAYAMVQLVDTSITPPRGTFSSGAIADPPNAANARGERR
ncbi:MAG: ATP-dependent Clp protease ATP-binding subunit [Patescibacteria group bacterium]|nr:ATP-dependent Clp protease ATP-binding subunit [Patescibacteria group bacterium]